MDLFVVSIPKIMLLYGGDGSNIEPIHRLLTSELDRKKFGLVIIRVRPSAMFDRILVEESHLFRALVDWPMFWLGCAIKFVAVDHVCMVRSSSESKW